MIVELFLSMFLSNAVPPEPLFFKHHMEKDDVLVMRELTYEWRRYNSADPPILFVYNYFDIAEQFRAMGIRAYSMTIALTAGHLKGFLDELPIKSQSLAMIVLLQKLTMPEVLMAADAVAVQGCLLVAPDRLPQGAQALLFKEGFRETFRFWHDHQIFRRESSESLEHKRGKVIAFRILTSA